jgi:hypothetical protein
MKSPKTMQMAAIMAVLVTAGLGIALVVGAITPDQLKRTLVKSLLVLAILALGSVAILAIAGSNKE